MKVYIDTFVMIKGILSWEESILNEFGKENIWKEWNIMKNHEKY